VNRASEWPDVAVLRQCARGEEGCLTKADGKAVVSSLGTRVGADRILVPSPGHSQRKNSALDSLMGYIVWGCWELKRKFRPTPPAPTCLNPIMYFIGLGVNQYPKPTTREKSHRHAVSANGSQVYHCAGKRWNGF
jgi:hypothetical protein